MLRRTFPGSRRSPRKCLSRQGHRAAGHLPKSHWNGLFVLVQSTQRMESGAVFSHLVRFGPFELGLQTAELSRNGRKLKLQEQPFRLLRLLLEHPGEVVTRERLKSALWPDDTFVDFE